MARATKTTPQPAAPAPAGRKGIRQAVPSPKATPVQEPAPAKSAPASASRSPAKPGRSAPRAPIAASAASAPKPSKDELRAQVERLEQANATLRAKSRDIRREAKLANGRVEELEAEVGRLTAQVARQTLAAKRAGTAKAPRATRKRAIGPSDEVPQGAAVLEPQPLDPGIEAARDALEEHRPGELAPTDD